MYRFSREPLQLVDRSESHGTVKVGREDCF